MNLLPVTGRLLFLAVCFSPLVQTIDASAAEANPAPPRITGSLSSNGLPRLAFPYPAAQEYTVYGAPEAGGPYTTPVPGLLSGPTFTVTNPAARGFYQVSVTSMSSNALLSATVLNRLTYGPSPADIARIASIGPEQFIAEQLAGDHGGFGHRPAHHQRAATRAAVDQLDSRVGQWHRQQHQLLPLSERGWARVYR
jgi:hypothetical protein